MTTVPGLVLLLGLLCQGSHSRATCCTSRAVCGDNACATGGSLTVTSKPAGFLVTAQNCNKVYDKRAFEKRPGIKYPDGVTGQTYTLVMVDPDALNRTLEMTYLHWIIANIPGEDFRNGNLKNSSVISSYVGPGPPKGTGLHRYMFYVYRHFFPNSRVTGTIGAPEREFFSLKEFLEGNSRRGVRLCGPVSGVQFRSAFSPPK